MPNQRWLSDHQGWTAWKRNMSKVQKRSAEHRRCPRCKRGNAINKHDIYERGNPIPFGYRKQCRWCKFIADEYDAYTGKHYSDPLDEDEQK